MNNKKLNININNYTNKLRTKEIEIKINNKKLNNPIELLEKLYLVRNNKSLNNEKKNKEVQKIMNSYMR